MELLGFVYVLILIVLSPVFAVCWVAEKAWKRIRHYRTSKRIAAVALKCRHLFDEFDKRFRI